VSFAKSKRAPWKPEGVKPRTEKKVVRPTVAKDKPELLTNFCKGAYNARQGPELYVFVNAVMIAFVDLPSSNEYRREDALERILVISLR
jgi:hypothetical protein